MQPDHIKLALVRSQIEPIVAGAIFAFFGLVCCAIAAMRRRGEVNTFIWLGVWSAMYGASNLVHSLALLHISAGAFETAAPYVVIAFTYFWKPPLCSPGPSFPSVSCADFFGWSSFRPSRWVSLA